MRRIVLPTILVSFAMLVLSGTAAHGDFQEQLEKVADQSTVVLTTLGRKSGDPHRVTIWFVVDGGRLYLQSGKGGETDWYRNVLANPHVTLNFEEVQVEGTAHPMDDPERETHVHGLFRDKYFLAQMSRWVGAGFGHGEVVEIRALE